MQIQRFTGFHRPYRCVIKLSSKVFIFQESHHLEKTLKARVAMAILKIGHPYPFITSKSTQKQDDPFRSLLLPVLQIETKP